MNEIMYKKAPMSNIISGTRIMTKGKVIVPEPQIGPSIIASCDTSLLTP